MGKVTITQPGRGLNSKRIYLMGIMFPRLFEEPGTVLYIGAWPGRFDGSFELVKAGHEITLVEIWKPFIEGLKKSRFASRITHLLQGDVREIDQIELPHQMYDYSMWLHGPEHVEYDEMEPTVKKLETLTKKCVVLGCPWGRFPHPIVWDNPYTKHRSHWYPENFMRLDYEVAAIGPKDVPGGHLLAWRWLNR